MNYYNKYTKTLIIISLIAIISLFLVSYIFNNRIKNINKQAKKQQINLNALPIIENNKKYIEEQTKIWIDRREKDLPCYGLLEKDKVIMADWMTKLNINSPKIYFYDYHDNFNIEKLTEILYQNPQKLIIKITHLQSNYGIILVKEGERDNKYISNLYSEILHKFNSCFVCNHDRSNPPSNKQINQGKKSSYYKLYQTVKPGIIIQEFFNSYDDKKIHQPIELKISVFGGYIINVQGVKMFEQIDGKRYQKVMDFVRDVSEKLGSTLVRVDVFVKAKDNPYIPYLNEISLSPNGGIKRNFLLSSSLLNTYKKEIEKRKPSVMEEIDNFYKDAPKRKIPIEYYFTDGDNTSEQKFKF